MKIYLKGRNSILNIIIFGTGCLAEKFISDIDKSKTEILFFTDNNIAKHFKEFMGFMVYPPEHILKSRYDHIFIASQYSLEIMQQLLDMRIPYGKIIPVDFILHNRI